MIQENVNLYLFLSMPDLFGYSLTINNVMQFKRRKRQFHVKDNIWICYSLTIWSIDNRPTQWLKRQSHVKDNMSLNLHLTSQVRELHDTVKSIGKLILVVHSCYRCPLLIIYDKLAIIFLWLVMLWWWVEKFGRTGNIQQKTVNTFGIKGSNGESLWLTYPEANIIGSFITRSSSGSP